MLRRRFVYALFGALLVASTAPAQDTRPMFQGQPVYRVGGGVLPPKALDTPDPKYPDKLRKKRIQGQVVLRLIVGADGAAHEITIDRSGGKDFDREAVKAVEHWKFQPATKDGEAVNAMINVEVNFRLY